MIILQLYLYKNNHIKLLSQRLPVLISSARLRNPKSNNEKYSNYNGKYESVLLLHACHNTQTCCRELISNKIVKYLPSLIVLYCNYIFIVMFSNYLV